jgi:hypothetical protein
MTPFAQSRAQILPFGQLPWQHFEKICLRLIWLDQSVEHTQSYGVQGDAQGGIDIYARHRESDLYSTYQCKNVEDFPASKIKEAVDVFLTGEWAKKSSTFVLCTRKALNTKGQADEIEQQAKRLRRKNITFLVWDGERLSMLLKEHPEIVDDFFDRGWVSFFFGSEVAEQLGQRLNYAQTEAALTAYHQWLRNEMGSVTYRGFSRGDHNSSVLELPIEHIYVAPKVKVEGRNKEQNRREHEILRQLDEEDGDEIDKAQLEEELRQIKAEEWRFLSPANLETLSGWGLASLFEDSVSTPIAEVLGTQNQCVVLGAPGSGKSLLLQWLALESVREQIEVDLPPATANLTDGTPRFPVFISLAAYANAVQKNKSVSLVDFIGQHLESIGIENVAALFRREWKENRCWILLDGLDEIADPIMRGGIVQRVESFLAACNQNRCTITSRIHGYERIKAVDCFQLQGFDREQASNFIFRWHIAVEMQTHPGEFDTDRVMERCRSLAEQINSNEHLAALAANPLLLVAMLLLHNDQGQLPQSRVEIYEAMTQTLLETWNRWRSQEQYDSGGQRLSASQLRKVLGRVALWSRREKPHGILRRAELKRQIVSALQSGGLGSDADQTAQSYLAAAVEQAGLLEERSPGIFAFWHPSFEEFLAASELAASPDQLASKLLPLRENSYWREVILLAVGLVGIVHEDKEAANECVRTLMKSDLSAVESVLHGALRLGAACVTENPRLPRVLCQEVLLELTRTLTLQPFEPVAGSFIETASALATTKPDSSLVLALGELVKIHNSMGPVQAASYRLLANVAATNPQAQRLCQEKVDAEIDRDFPEKEVMARFYATIGLVRAGSVTGGNLAELVWHNRPIGFIQEVVELLSLSQDATDISSADRESRLAAIWEVLESSFPPVKSSWPPKNDSEDDSNAILPSLAAALILLFAGQDPERLDDVIEEALKPKYDSCGGVFDAAQATQMFSSENQERDVKRQRLALVAFRRWLNHPRPYREIYAAETLLKWIESWEEEFSPFIESHSEFQGRVEEAKDEKFFEAYQMDRQILRREALACLKKCLPYPNFQTRLLAAGMLVQRGEVRAVAKAIEKWTKTAPKSFPGLSILPLVGELSESEEGHKIVAGWLKSDNDWLKCAAASTLSAKFAKESQQALKECLLSPHDEVRSAIAGMLAMFHFARKQPLPQEVEAALRSCLASKQGDASQNAANALHRFDHRDEEVMNCLLPYLFSQQMGARFETIRAIQDQNEEGESFIEGLAEEMGLQTPELSAACNAVLNGQPLGGNEALQLLSLTTRRKGDEPLTMLLRRSCMDWLWWNLEIKPSPQTFERDEKFFPDAGLDREDTVSE